MSAEIIDYISFGVGIFSLCVGIVSLVLTIISLKKIGDVETAVKNTRDEDFFKSKIPTYLDEINFIVSFLDNLSKDSPEKEILNEYFSILRSHVGKLSILSSDPCFSRLSPKGVQQMDAFLQFYEDLSQQYSTEKLLETKIGTVIHTSLKHLYFVKNELEKVG